MHVWKIDCVHVIIYRGLKQLSMRRLCNAEWSHGVIMTGWPFWWAELVLTMHMGGLSESSKQPTSRINGSTSVPGLVFQFETTL